MRAVTGKLALLRKEPRHAASSIAAAALPWAEPGEIDELARVALRVPGAANVAAVIGVLHHLRPDTIDALEAPPIPAASALRLLRSRQALLNGIAVARRRGDPHLLTQLVGFLSTPYADVPRRAAAAILDIVTRHAGRDGRRRMSDRTAALIDVAVSAAVTGADRRLDEVFLAAAILAVRPGRRLEALLDDPRHPVQFSIRRVVGRADHPLVRHNLLRWLATDPLRGQAARSLHRVRGYADLLAGAHLLLQPFRRRVMRHLDRPARCLPDLETAAALPADAQVDLVRFVRAMPINGAARRERLADCAVLPAPTARLNALLGLLGDDSDEAKRLVELMCADADEAVASLAAARVLDAARPPDPELLRTLEAGAHPRIAARAITLAAGAGVDAFFERWLRVGPADRAAIGHRLLRTRRVSLISGLRAAMARGGRQERLAAIALADRLGLGSALEPALIGEAAADDPRVASAAVTALGSNPSPHARHALRVALDHQDARVQANALEAVTRLDRAAIDRLRDRLDSPDNRVRGNAVRAALRRRGRDGAGALRAMLGDGDPRHRVSAIWVARRAREGRISADLRRIADHDEIEEIRRRARATVEWIGA